MKFLARLVTGKIALWVTFWLIATPISIVWDLTGLAMLTGYGVGEPATAVALLVVFVLACIAAVFCAVAVWRSSSNYPRQVWRQWVIVIAAKLCAVICGLSATVSFVTVAYLAADFIQAIFLPS
jgi:hypothetical protein